jgi:hypothetical protein
MMIRKILVLLVALACVVFSHEIPDRADYEGGTDHIIFDGHECRIHSFPLNEFIAEHYAEWPFRPLMEFGYGNPPVFTYFTPRFGGGYSAFWSIRDSSLYLDSVKINSLSRSVSLSRALYYDKEDNRVVSVNIPPKEIVLNTSAEKRVVKTQNNESVLADFVSDTISFSCGNLDYTSILKGYRCYELGVDKGRVVYMPRATSDCYRADYEDGARELPQPRTKIKKKKRYEKLPKLYHEYSSPFADYYKILDSLRQVLDDKGNVPYLEVSRKDPKFKRFEDFFNIHAVNRSYWHPVYCGDEEYAFYVSLKGDTPFNEIVLRLREGEPFLENPVESIKLFLKTLIAVRKNPSFEKWLRYKMPLMNYKNVSLQYRDSIAVVFELFPKELVWNKVGMSGQYVGSLVFLKEYVPQYEFILNDAGDVLVTCANLSEDEWFFDVPVDKKDWIYKKFGIASLANMQRCTKPESEKEPLGKLCNYMIIRHDGTIEYGPESGAL